MTQRSGPDRELADREQAQYQALADKTGEVVMVTDSRPARFYPQQGQRATDKEAGS